MQNGYDAAVGPCGGIGRRGRLKICCPLDVGVRFSLGAPPSFFPQLILRWALL